MHRYRDGCLLPSLSQLCIFNLSLHFFSILYDFAHHPFSARYYLISATTPTSLLNFISALQVNIAFSLVRIYIPPVSSVSLSICFHPICPAEFTNNQLRSLLEFIFGFKLRSLLCSYQSQNCQLQSFLFTFNTIRLGLQLQNCQLQSSLFTFITFRSGINTQILFSTLLSYYTTPISN
jgi:hypothetical protein